MKKTLLLGVAVILGAVSIATYAGRDELQRLQQQRAHERIKQERVQTQAMLEECAKMMRSNRQDSHE